MEISKEELKEVIVQAISESKTDKLTLTLAEAVKFSGIGKNKLWELIYKENTDFPYFKVGTKVLINKDMLVNWLEKTSVEGRVL